MSDLSVIGEAIRHYKLNSGGGYAAWSKVPCTDDYKMHVPSMGFNTAGPIENGKFIFGWLADIKATQELVNIVEFGSYITCYLKRSDKDGGVLDVVEVFKTDDTGKVEEI
jgi:hypothetical protein|tara:strand:+ start:374 stop:703 length:330 start_codon:yes stop_codon:yes gene_type:complete